MIVGCQQACPARACERCRKNKSFCTSLSRPVRNFRPGLGLNPLACGNSLHSRGALVNAGRRLGLPDFVGTRRPQTCAFAVGTLLSPCRVPGNFRRSASRTCGGRVCLFKALLHPANRTRTSMRRHYRRLSPQNQADVPCTRATALVNAGHKTCAFALRDASLGQDGFPKNS